MRASRTKLAAVAVAMFAMAACSDSEQKSATPSVGAASAQADNTARNVRDRDEATLTPLDQSNSAPDLALTQEIRSGITSNDAMSMQARNVKVITRDGVVTLRGPVQTEQEKSTIGVLAKDAGATRVDNQLEIDRDGTSGSKE